MPKVLLYVSAKITWIFLFFGTDVNESRAHVHVGKKSTGEYCKICLEPKISIAKGGTLTTAELNEVLKITTECRFQLVEQWRKFTEGKTIKMITVKK